MTQMTEADEQDIIKQTDEDLVRHLKCQIRKGKLPRYSLEKVVSERKIPGGKTIKYTDWVLVDTVAKVIYGY